MTWNRHRITVLVDPLKANVVYCQSLAERLQDRDMKCHYIDLVSSVTGRVRNRQRHPAPGPRILRCGVLVDSAGDLGHSMPMVAHQDVGPGVAGELRRGGSSSKHDQNGSYHGWHLRLLSKILRRYRRDRYVAGALELFASIAIDVLVHAAPLQKAVTSLWPQTSPAGLR